MALLGKSFYGLNITRPGKLSYYLICLFLSCSWWIFRLIHLQHPTTQLMTVHTFSFGDLDLPSSAFAKWQCLCLFCAVTKASNGTSDKTDTTSLGLYFHFWATGSFPNLFFLLLPPRPCFPNFLMRICMIECKAFLSWDVWQQCLASAKL